MLRGRLLPVLVLGLVALVSLTTVCVAQKKEAGLWTDPKDESLPVDFKIQGEYVGEISGGGKLGGQVIALGKESFQAVLFPGGLPGDGWDGTNKILLDGKLDGSKAVFTAPSDFNKKKYLGRSPEEFAATLKLPPPGQKPYSGTIEKDTLSGKTEEGKTFELKKVVRKSVTLGAKPPEGALVLFNGSNTDEWSAGRLDKENGILNTDGKDLRSKKKFNNYTVHVEFMLPYRPDARGQERGNSGFYQVDMYEVQVLDSFGLDGKNNECGGIYSQVDSKLNMCYPPLTWQTYDIDFTNAAADDSGKKTRNARITAKLNGVVIHDDTEIKTKTGGARSDPEGTPGPLQLQGHGNPLQYRNIWIVEKK